MGKKWQMTVYCRSCGKKHSVSLNTPLGRLSYCKKCSRIVETECVVCHKKFKTNYYNTIGGYTCPHCVNKSMVKIKNDIRVCNDILVCLNTIDNPSIFRYVNLKTWIFENEKLMKPISEIQEIIEHFPNEALQIPSYVNLSKKMALITHEAEIFGSIQKQLQYDIKTESNENLAYWKKVLQILERCKTSVRQDDNEIECYFKDFPIAKSCCSAIRQLITDIEIRKAVSLKQVM